MAVRVDGAVMRPWRGRTDTGHAPVHPARRGPGLQRSDLLFRARWFAGEEGTLKAGLSAGAVVVRRFPGGHRYLLLRAYRNWDFPKGMVEPGEEPLAAALREVREEAGLGDLSFPWGEVFVETEPYAGGKVARYYLAGSARDEVRLGAGPSGRREHHEHRWVGHAEGRALLVERLRTVIDWAEARVAGA